MRNSTCSRKTPEGVYISQEDFPNWLEGRYAYSLNFATKMCGKDAAPDIVQDVFAKLCKVTLKEHHPAAVQKLLRTSLRNSCYDFLRTKKRVLKNSGSDEDNDTISRRGRCDVGVKDTVLLANHILDSIPPEEARLLKLFYIDGLTCEETAEICNISAGTVKSRLFYIRKRVRDNYLFSLV